MSQPPGEHPDDQPGNGMSPGQHPQYPQYPQYGYPPPNPNAVSVGAVIGGVFLFPVLNIVVGFITVMVADQQNVLLAFGAALLALIAFGGGFTLWKSGNPVPKGLGLGLMIGWALTSILTVGYCTGLNPAMYT